MHLHNDLFPLSTVVLLTLHPSASLITFCLSLSVCKSGTRPAILDPSAAGELLSTGSLAREPLLSSVSAQGYHLSVALHRGEGGADTNGERQ